MRDRKLIIGIVVTFVLVVGFFITDMATGDTIYVKGTVIEKEYSPARITNQPSVISTGKTTIVTSNVKHIPEKWEVLVNIPAIGSKEWKEVSEKKYEMLTYGNKINLKFRVGGITGWNY